MTSACMGLNEIVRVYASKLGIKNPEKILASIRVIQTSAHERKKNQIWENLAPITSEDGLERIIMTPACTGLNEIVRVYASKLGIKNPEKILASIRVIQTSTRERGKKQI